MKLIDRLTEYGASDFYGFHMPGHKRRQELGITLFPNPFSVDITEIEGFDNLHHPEGILKESMEQAAKIYGADQTYYLVNGSTCGILAALSSAVLERGTVLMARNSHKSAYHGAVLRGFDTVYLYPEYLDEYGIQGGISASQVEELLEKDKKKKIRAVFITSPTYEGIVSDVYEIGEAVHRHGLPLIVDEAHGAHFPFYSGNGKNRKEGRLFPASALSQGADAVIQSLHKTLPSLTQTALLHVQGDRIDRERLEFYLRVYQSSSPSYIFMASIENCIQYMNSEGRERLKYLGKNLEEWMKQAERWNCLSVLDDSVIGTGAVFDRDPSKLAVGIRPQVREILKRLNRNEGYGKYSATELAGELRDRFHLEPEMCCDGYVLLMTSLMDRKEALSGLMDALCTIDREMSALLKKEEITGQFIENKSCSETYKKEETHLTWTRSSKKIMTIADALEKPGRKVRLQEAAGLVSRGFLTVYPPGVPAVVPGEEISKEAVKMLCHNLKLGLTVEGVSEDKTVDTVKL